MSHPPLVCGHLEAVYLEKNNNLFYSCWEWKIFCPPKRWGLIGISGREIVAFYGGNTCVRLCSYVLVNAGVTPTPRSIVLLRGSLLKVLFLGEGRKGLMFLETSICTLNIVQ